MDRALREKSEAATDGGPTVPILVLMDNALRAYSKLKEDIAVIYEGRNLSPGLL